MPQLRLFDDGQVSHSNPPNRERSASSSIDRPTSRRAAESIQSDAAGIRERIWRLLRDRGADGATDGEIQAALHLTGDTERPRRRELQQAGRVQDSGRTRSTPAGRQAVVWLATETATTEAATAAE